MRQPATPALVVLALALVAVAAPAGSRDEPPLNVVFILVDDLGYMDIGANNELCFYDTPHIDGLAATGVRFTNAYAACCVCSPTRASLLTGCYPPRTVITDYINPGRGNQPENWRRKTKLLPASFETQLALEERTVAEALRDGGYATFFAGKWHLGGPGFYPEQQGFDVNKGGIERGGPYGGKKYFSPYGNPKLTDGPEGEHLPDRLARETVRFMRENRDRPFFAMLSFYSVHTPLMGRPDLVAKYEAKRNALPPRDEAWRPEGARRTRIVQDHAVYGAMVEAMDEAVGTVLAGIDELGLADRTAVIFFSDNGGLSTSEGHPTSNEPLRAGKGWLYEGGIREPCIVRVPGGAANAVCDTPVISTDFFPTILEFAGRPAEPEAHRDGRSLLPLLRAPASPVEARSLFWHYPHYGNQGGAPGGAIRLGKWKLIEHFEDDTVELYDLEVDPGERRDLSAVHEDRVNALRDELRAWRATVNARMPTERE